MCMLFRCIEAPIGSLSTRNMGSVYCQNYLYKPALLLSNEFNRDRLTINQLPFLLATLASKRPFSFYSPQTHLSEITMPHTKSPMDKFNDDYGRWHKNALDAVASERSIWIWLMNNTDEDLTWSDSGVDHGERCKLAPDTIAARDWGSWKLQSCGF